MRKLGAVFLHVLLYFLHTYCIKLMTCAHCALHSAHSIHVLPIISSASIIKIVQQLTLSPARCSVYLDSVCGQKCGGTRSPEQLAEAVKRLLVNEAALKVPYPEGVVHLVAPVGHGRAHIATCHVPFHVCGHKVLCQRH
jgi:hypothetical protein